MSEIKVLDLKKTFFIDGKEIEVLKGINLEILKGKITVIWGPSGAGKTTLLHILGTLDRPTQGKVIWEGRDISNLKESELLKLRREKIGFIFQFFHLLPDLTCYENVMLPLLIKRLKICDFQGKIKKILKELGIYERKDHFPSQLSGGEQQRVCIARTLVSEPEYIFCDEPTGSLDSRNSEKIIEILLRLNREYDKTMILVTHQKELIEIADQIYYLSDGKIRKEER